MHNSSSKATELSSSSDPQAHKSYVDLLCASRIKSFLIGSRTFISSEDRLSRAVGQIEHSLALNELYISVFLDIAALIVCPEVVIQAADRFEMHPL